MSDTPRGMEPQFNRRVLEVLGLVVLVVDLLVPPAAVWVFGWVGLVFVPFAVGAAAFMVLLYLPMVRRT